MPGIIFPVKAKENVSHQVKTLSIHIEVVGLYCSDKGQHEPDMVHVRH